MPTHVELLQRMPIFGAVADAPLQFLLERARGVTVAAGDFFFRQGDQATSMFVLESGLVEVMRAWGGRTWQLRELGEGDCFGEMALLDLYPRSAGVRALAECRAIEISSDDLLALFEHDLMSFALIQMNLAREMSRRLRSTDELLFRAWMGDVVPPETLAPGLRGG